MGAQTFGSGVEHRENEEGLKVGLDEAFSNLHACVTNSTNKQTRYWGGAEHRSGAEESAEGYQVVAAHQACEVEKGVGHAGEQADGKKSHSHALNTLLDAADQTAVRGRCKLFIELSRALVLQARRARSPVRRKLADGGADTPAEGPPPHFTVVVEDGVAGVVADVSDYSGGEKQHKRVEAEAHSEGGQKAEPHPVHDAGDAEVFAKIEAAAAQVQRAQLHIEISGDGDSAQQDRNVGMVASSLDGRARADVGEQEAGFEGRF